MNDSLMEIKFRCRFCKSKLSAEENLYGSKINCPKCKSMITIPTPKFEHGERIDGYEIEQWLGQGAMGEVYLATQVTMQRSVAIKVHNQRVHDLSEEEKQEFNNEIRTLAKLSHPNIVTAYEAGIAKNSYYLTMSYVNGDSLEEWIEVNGPFEEKHALKICIEVSKALQYAWEKFQLLHRDIKSSNIMIDSHGNVKLMDLGIAIQLGDDAKENIMVGTPYFMSPEQARFGSNVDDRSDIYSLGATLYHMLTGYEPYKGYDSMEIIKLKQEVDPEWPQDLNEDLSDEVSNLIMHMMNYDPDERPQSWDEVIQLLSKTIRPRKAKVANNNYDNQTTINYNAAEKAAHRAQRLKDRRHKKGFPFLLIFIILVFIAMTIGGVFMAYKIVEARKQKLEFKNKQK